MRRSFRTPIAAMVGILALAGCHPTPEPTPSTPTREFQWVPIDDPDRLRGLEARAREVPENLDLALKKRTEIGGRLVSIRAARTPLELNRIHNWWIRIANPKGEPEDGLQLQFSGGMPAHGHGFPTSPQVTRGIGNGTYLVEGVKFNMSGWWEFVIEIVGKEGDLEDRVRFNLVLDE